MRITSLDTEGISRIGVDIRQTATGAIHVEPALVARSRPVDVVPIVAPIGGPRNVNGMPFLVQLANAGPINWAEAKRVCRCERKDAQEHQDKRRDDDLWRNAAQQLGEGRSSHRCCHAVFLSWVSHLILVGDPPYLREPYLDF